MSVTGIPGFDWVLAGLYAVAGALALGSAFWRSPGYRTRGVLLVPLLVGLGGIVVLAIAFGNETQTFLRNVGNHGASIVVVAIVLLIAGALGDFFVARVARNVVGWGVVQQFPVDGLLALILLLPLVIGFVGLVKLDETALSGYELAQATPENPIEAEHVLPAEPMDIALQSSSAGYVSLLDGRIIRFTLADQGRELEYTTAASGLESPRGLAIVGDSLIVADVGRLPCHPQFPCKGADVTAASSVVEGERKILQDSSARLVRFDIRPGGTLGNRRTILDRLPVANSEHALNAVTAGSDGRIYVSVGNVDGLAKVPLSARELARPNFELMGTVFSVRPDGSDLRIVAHGLRNVYDLVFDGQGRLYGADNDGVTRSGWRREEVVQIQTGGDYGYPFEGTFAPTRRRTAFPLWVLDTVGSAGVEWLRVGMRPNLAVGSCGNVDLIALERGRGTATVTDPGAVRRLLEHLPGCVTAIKRLAADRILVALFRYDGPPVLDVVRVVS